MRLKSVRWRVGKGERRIRKIIIALKVTGGELC